MVKLKRAGGIMAAVTDKAALTIAAREKIATGGLMTLAEVAALLDVSTSTVHGLPLPSIRLGRSLRYAPQDVRLLIELCREPVAGQG